MSVMVDIMVRLSLNVVYVCGLCHIVAGLTTLLLFFFFFFFWGGRCSDEENPLRATKKH